MIAMSVWSYVSRKDVWTYYIACFSILLPIAIWEIIMVRA
jgi:hypothetical protein